MRSILAAYAQDATVLIQVFRIVKSAASKTIASPSTDSDSRRKDMLHYCRVYGIV